MIPELLYRHYFDAGALMADHSPRWRHPNKQAVFDAILAAGQPFSGRITYARWAEAPLPQTVTARSRFEPRLGPFGYELTTEPGAVEWHMNFADPRLFFAYGSPLLAQDELQVAEHPLLAALREALLAMGQPAATVDERGRPTPVTVFGVQRHGILDTRPNPAAGRPLSLYGNAFARAPLAQAVAATTPLVPPTVSNILALAALGYGHGPYSQEDVDHIVGAAATGFLAARCESAALAPASSRTVIHTGFWGCGAFGGNRVLMTILQVLAADLADVDVVFHALDQAGLALAADAHDLYVRLRDAASSTSQLLATLVRQGYQWGVSDGN